MEGMSPRSSGLIRHRQKRANHMVSSWLTPLTRTIVALDPRGRKARAALRECPPVYSRNKPLLAHAQRVFTSRSGRGKSRREGP